MLIPLTVLVWVLLTTIPASHCKDCPIKYHGISEHSACLPKSVNVKIEGVTPKDRLKILTILNKIRLEVKPPPCRMKKLYWDNDLAIVAQKWSSNCNFTFDRIWNRLIPGKFGAGQNIAIDVASWDEAIDSWYKESEKFAYGKNNAYSIVRNYVQIIHESISRIGCGFAECTNDAGRFFVCNYAPGPFKMEELNKPYETCNATLPLKDCEGAICLNGGIMYDTSCACRCPLEELTYGSNCHLNCSVTEDPCPCESKYTTADCHKDINICYLCPNLCKICPYFALPDSGMKHSVDGTCLAFSVVFFHFILVTAV